MGRKDWNIPETQPRNVHGLCDMGPFRRGKVLEYVKRMSKPNERVLFDDRVAAILLEQGFTLHEEPRSVYDPEQLWQSLERYAPCNNALFDAKDPHILKGIDLAWKVFARPERYRLLKPLDDKGAITEAMKLDKSAGLPSMGKKKDDLIYALDREEQVRQGLKKPNPCIAGARTQKNNKTRLVWMFPFEMTIMESRFARPLIDLFLGYKRTTMAFGMKTYELGQFLEHNVKAKGIPLALDYSKFDSSIPSVLIQAAFNILATWYSKEDRDKFSWNMIEDYFIHTPIVMPNGHLYVGKRHGVPSGSYFTQMIDSIVNTILIGALLHAFKQPVNWKNIYVLGDDCIFPVYARLDVNSVAGFLIKYGIKVNKEKSVYGELHFLGAEWSRGAPDLALEHVIAKAINPEKFRIYPQEAEAKQFAKMIICGYVSAYKSASDLLPMTFWNDGFTEFDGYAPETRHETLSGYIRYKFDEVWKMRREGKYRTIDARFWG